MAVKTGEWRFFLHIISEQDSFISVSDLIFIMHFYNWNYKNARNWYYFYSITVSSRGLKTLCKFERCKIFAKILHKSKKRFSQFFTHFAEFFADSFAKNFADLFAKNFADSFAKFFAHIFTPFCTYVGTYLDIYDATYDSTYVVTYINGKKFAKWCVKNM